MECEFLTADELADLLNVSPDTIRRWVRRGRIPDVRPSPRVQRFIMADVLAALRAKGGRA